MEKLNIAELLRDCPIGMELDSTIVDELYFGEVTENNMIKCYTKQYSESACTCNTIYFHYDGTYLTTQNAKCVIFPKGKTTWEGFQRPFKDGDVVTDIEGAIIIYKGITTSGYCGSFVSLDRNNQFIPHCISYLNYIRLATEEEKQKLFDAIKANGYRWNPKTKTLEKLVVPKFKVGDRIKSKYIHKDNCAAEYTIIEVYAEYYKTDCGTLPFENQDDYKLAPNKFDITTLKPFDKILTRDGDKMCWYANIYSHYLGKDKLYQFRCMGTIAKQCIPYKGNEHLLGTKNDCDEYYKTWE